MRYMHGRAFFQLLCVLFVVAATSVRLPAQVRVVNMTPQTRSGETFQDAEPNLAVNHANPLQIVGSAFTPDPMGGANAPIYVSTDGGNTWALNSIVPGNGPVGTGDITVRFGGSSGILYVGALRGDSSLRLNILRTNNYTGAGVMDVLVDRTQVDQPYIQAATVLGGTGTGNDRVYVGNNDLAVASAGGRKTASIDQHLDVAAVAPAPPSGFTIDRIETRGTGGANQDGPPIRPAIHPNGTIYGIFYHWSAFSGTAATADVVVVRDDNWGTSATPFTALTDPSDTLAGRRVVTGITVPWNNTNQASFGQERFVGSNITIAVDPTDSNRVYIAWADRVGATDYTLHVRRSTDGGNNWSADLMTVTNATNPALAINTHGRIGFLYQQLTGAGASQRWETHLQRSDDGTTWTDLVLARPLANTPVFTFRPYLGDYVHLSAVGKNFYGIFSANNTPDMANFPNGVTYQRNANFATNTLTDLSNNPVANSIDPFFFQVTEVADADDFYVRDWTDNPTSGDSGVEPSTHSVFYSTSDVWNRRGTLPGSFPNDQPENEDAGNGLGNIGDNWAFARVRRNALPASGSKLVTAHFLVSKFGTGSNYVDGSMDPDVIFMGADPTLTFNQSALGPLVTVGQQWHLDPVASTHLCLAVEISAPGDPFVAPSLLGNAPGWPTTDLRVINDNNKAQRNIGLSTTPARGVGASVTFHALIHNAATFPRDMTLRYDAPLEVQRRLQGARVSVVGGESRPFRSGDMMILKQMQPGENRWVALTYNAPQGRDGEMLPVNFYEMVGNAAVNGFTIAARPSSMNRVMRDNLELHRSVFTRMAAGFKTAGAEEQAIAAQKLNSNRIYKEDEYMRLLQTSLRGLETTVRAQLAAGQQPDAFGAGEALETLKGALRAGKSDVVSVAHASLLQKLDAHITMQQLAQGDPADVLQNIRWQKDLFVKQPALSRLRCASSLTRQSDEFIRAYGMRKVSNKDYPAFVERTMGCLADASKMREMSGSGAERDIEEIRRNSGNLRSLQKAHRDLLLKFQRLVR
ncbi:MAG TPA: sialidase family protein [Pyrinomonadaceae bacterium]|nr:sialidase family protein [Pyrinomonadaceae bacterium]